MRPERADGRLSHRLAAATACTASRAARRTSWRVSMRKTTHVSLVRLCSLAKVSPILFTGMADVLCLPGAIDRTLLPSRAREWTGRPTDRR